MTTEIKRRSYEEIDTIFKNKRDLILKNNSGIASLIEEMIDTSFYLSEIMKEVFLEEYKKTGKEFEGPSALIPILWDKNNKYLIASYKLAMLGLINPSNSLIRNVFEGITQIYLLHLTDREAELFYKKQLDTW